MVDKIKNLTYSQFIEPLLNSTNPIEQRYKATHTLPPQKSDEFVQFNPAIVIRHSAFNCHSTKVLSDTPFNTLLNNTNSPPSGDSILNEAVTIASNEGKKFNNPFTELLISERNLLAKYQNIETNSRLEGDNYIIEHKIPKDKRDSQIEAHKSVIKLLEQIKDLPYKQVISILGLSIVSARQTEEFKRSQNSVMELAGSQNTQNKNPSSSIDFSTVRSQLEKVYSNLVSEYQNVLISPRLFNIKDIEIDKIVKPAIEQAIKSEKEQLSLLDRMKQDNDGDYIQEDPGLSVEFVRGKIAAHKKNLELMNHVINARINGGVTDRLAVAIDLTQNEIAILSAAKNADQIKLDAANYALRNIKTIQNTLDNDQQSQLLLDRAEANKRHDYEPLKKYFPVMQYLEKYVPHKYKAFQSMVSKIMTNTQFGYLQEINLKDRSNRAHFEATKEAGELDYSSRAAIAISIAEVFFNKPERIDNVLNRREPIVLGRNHIPFKIILTEKFNDESMFGLHSGVHNLISVSRFWESVLKANSIDPLDENTERIKFTLIHEVTTALEIKDYVNSPDGVFEDWNQQFTDAFVAERKRLFKKADSDNNLTDKERYSGMGAYAFELTDVKDGYGNADNFLSDLLATFRRNPAVLKKYNPVHYKMLVQDLGYDPIKILKYAP
ncbi:MAG: hypothetical protein HYR97_03930 [Candidatus Melainabacteria bacterium]|nr:hypothetical protein [Candidatus Melainabacteria bacterium]